MKKNTVLSLVLILCACVAPKNSVPAQPITESSLIITFQYLENPAGTLPITEILRFDMIDNTVTLLSESNGFSYRSPIASPSGDWIAYVREEAKINSPVINNPQEPEGDSSIWLMKPDGSEKHQISPSFPCIYSSDGREFWPVKTLLNSLKWSSTGDYLQYAFMDQEVSILDYYIYDSTSGQQLAFKEGLGLAAAEFGWAKMNNEFFFADTHKAMFGVIDNGLVDLIAIDYCKSNCFPSFVYWKGTGSKAIIWSCADSPRCPSRTIEVNPANDTVGAAIFDSGKLEAGSWIKWNEDKVSIFNEPYGELVSVLELDQSTHNWYFQGDQVNQQIQWIGVSKNGREIVLANYLGEIVKKINIDAIIPEKQAIIISAFILP